MGECVIRLAGRDFAQRNVEAERPRRAREMRGIGEHEKGRQLSLGARRPCFQRELGADAGWIALREGEGESGVQCWSRSALGRPESCAHREGSNFPDNLRRS